MTEQSPEWTPTEAQAELIYEDGTRFVEACPGAGKTRAIVDRFQRLTGLAGRRGVALLSFTNAAVDEVRRRCEDPRTLLSPNFAGTFDSFINRFITGPAMAARLRRYPRFVESWTQVPAASFSVDQLPQGLEFTLEYFDWDFDGEYRFFPEWATRQYGNVFRKTHQQNAPAVDVAARSLRDRLINYNRIVPCSESRHIALRVLRDPEQGPAIVQLLKRFGEILVDEAQDCGPHELAILRAALQAGVQVVAVGDLDQAIFEFRRATPDAVRRFADDVGPGRRLAGNFRSTPAIVRVGGLLRASDQQDEALGPEASNPQDVIVVPFHTLADAGVAVRDRLAAAGIEASGAVVLAHRADDAAGCAGATPPGVTSKRAVMVFADAALAFVVTDDPARRRHKITQVEWSLLRAAGSRTSLAIDEACEEVGVSPRWLREAATRVVLGVDPRQGNRIDYTTSVRQVIQGLSWPTGTVISNQRLATPPEAAWTTLEIGAPADSPPLSWTTVHGAKGREFDAVILVIPKTLRPDDGGLTCLDHWEQGSDSESRRVLYVGATRAEQLLIVAVHQDHIQRIQSLLA